MESSETKSTAFKSIPLEAKYSSPSNQPFTHSHQIASSSSPANTSLFLSNLRTAADALQGQINKELTARMEEDKALAGGNASAKGVDEEKEEENYGEEVQGED